MAPFLDPTNLFYLEEQNKLKANKIKIKNVEIFIKKIKNAYFLWSKASIIPHYSANYLMRHYVAYLRDQH